MVKIGVLITARLKSARLPLKLLLPLGNKKVIDHVVERAKQIYLSNEVILCTSFHPQDKPLADAALTHRIHCFNGDDHDVLQRLYDAATFYSLDYILSVTGDNPFFSIEYANQMANVALLNKPDYLTVKGLPLGISMYGIRYEALKTVIAFKEGTEADTEIWGQWFNQPQFFNIKTLDARPEEHRSTRLTLDTYEDYLYLQKIYEECTMHPASLRMILDAVDQLPRGYEFHRHVKQKQLTSLQKSQIDQLYLAHADRFSELKKQIYAAPTSS